MATILKIPIVWTGLTGLPGVTVSYAPSTSTTAPADWMTFLTAIRGHFTTGLQWQVPTNGDTINDATGELNGTWSLAGGGVQTGNSGSGTYAAGVGCRVKWLTGGIVHGRRVRGSTFLTGLITGDYDSSGTILNTALTTFTNAAITLAASGSLVIWSRPYTFNPAHPDIPTRSGSSFAVNGQLVPDQVTSLRSRRV